MWEKGERINSDLRLDEQREREIERNNLHGGQNLLKTHNNIRCSRMFKRAKLPKGANFIAKYWTVFCLSQAALENKVLPGRVAQASVYENSTLSNSTQSLRKKSIRQ